MYVDIHKYSTTAHKVNNKQVQIIATLKPNSNIHPNLYLNHTVIYHKSDIAAKAPIDH